MSRNKQRIYLIVGKSGSGKTTAINRICRNLPFLHQIQSYTTRKPRYENENGHIFVDENTFLNLQELCAYTFFNGNHYGCTRQQIEDNDFYIIDPDGISFMLNEYKGNKEIYVIYIKSNIFFRISNMYHRKDDIKNIIKRVINDSFKFNSIKKIKKNNRVKFYQIKNKKNHLEDTCSDIVDIVFSE